MTIDTWPADGSSPVFIRGYSGDTYEDVIEAFHRDAVLLLAEGYEPAGQHYVEGQWSVWRAVLATILLAFLVGAFLWAQMLVSRPIGTLTVTYVHRSGTK
jgi:hypothetical protein